MTVLKDLKRLFLFDLPRDGEDDDGLLRRDERQAAVLADKLPSAGEEVERQSELRLAKLLQYPHF
jgi:hypothetical protein